MKYRKWIGLLALAGVIAAILAFMEWRGRQRPPADQPTPRIRLLGVIPSPRWMGLHQALVEKTRQAARNGGLDIYFLGDSLTDHWQFAGLPVWQREFGSRRAGTFGIGGDGTHHILWRVQNSGFDALKPNVVVIAAGTNNLGSHKPDEIAAGIAAIVKEVQTRSPTSKIVLMGITPYGVRVDDPMRARAREVNKLIRGLDDGRRIRFVDYSPLLVEADGRLSEAMEGDGVHLTEKGYAIWADALRPVLDEWLGPPPSPR